MKALVLVDIQNDFLPAGALPVPQGDRVVPVANELMKHFELVVATRDWHPPEHKSFASNHPGKKPGDLIELHGRPQRLWPDHCVQGTSGAEFAPGLQTSGLAKIFHKGQDPEIDSYSGFFDNARLRATGLESFLKENGADELYILGLATDYCVKFTALDAVELGFKTYLVEDGCRGVDLTPGDVDRALEEMKQARVVITTSERLASAGR